MAYLKDTMSRRRNECGQTNQSRDSFIDKAPLGGRPIPEVPIPLKNGRLATLTDAGVKGDLLSEHSAAGSKRNSTSHGQPAQLMREKHESYAHLNRSLLVRLNVERPNGEIVQVLCVTEDISRTGLKLRLPCRLDFRSGTMIDMELLTSPENPVAVKAVVHRVLRTAGEDIVRYLIEVQFKNLSRPAQQEINAFIQAAQMEERRIVLA